MPKLPKFAYLAAGLIAGVTFSVGGAYALTHSSIDVFAQAPDAVTQPDAPLAFSQVFSYQARLLTPGSGDVKPDGVYQITFSIYKVVTGGSALWTETKSVTVANGAFTSLIGDSTPLPLNIFTGQDLYLGIKVGD